MCIEQRDRFTVKESQEGTGGIEFTGVRRS